MDKILEAALNIYNIMVFEKSTAKEDKGLRVLKGHNCELCGCLPVGRVKENP